MYFLDEHFLLGFVPLVFAAYWLTRGWLRNLVLLAANVSWLAVFSPQTLIAMAGLIVLVIYPITRFAGRRFEIGDKQPANRIGWLGVVSVIGLAAALRLHDAWLPEQVDASLLRWLGFSYFLLKAIHAMRGSARGLFPTPSLITLGQYLLFFPTLTSGPIYRLDTFTEQLTAPKTLAWDDIEVGLTRVVIGIAKKLVLAEPLSKLAVPLHAQHVWQPAAYPLTYVVLFLDFSGYTDIAIGIGRLFGFRIPENFKSPFTATTLTQFWRNWHATLSDWLRENVFLPMGGMRAKGWHLSLIVLGSMFVIGIWHAFSLVFVAWGLYHGLCLLIENWIDIKPLRPHRTPKWKLLLRYALVQATIMVGMFAFIGNDLG